MPDLGEKTEAPTPRRLAEAREKGQVARSADLSAAVGLLVGLLLLNWQSPALLRGFGELIQEAFAFEHAPTAPAQVLDETWRMMLRHGTALLLPFVLVLTVAAIAVNFVQVGFLFTAFPLVPSLDKISPLKGLARLFSKRTLLRLALSLTKVAVITVVAYLTIRARLAELLSLSALPFPQAVGHAGRLVFALGLRLSVVLVVLALLDYGLQRYQLWQDLRMTREELREELKRMEGDPLMRQRRLHVARQLAAHRMSQAVPKADVVVTNPTHLAVALKYDHERMPSPKVVAKGAGYVAQRIRDIANEHGVPIVERKPLAQALYKACEVGDYVPPQLYKAVAEVLAFVFELAGKGYRRRAATA